MNADFSRILTLLRKERGLSQKQAAGELGISQALLSHYEKGIRECGLDFLVRAANFYGVSCDYLLGRSPERTGMTLTVEDIPEPDAQGKENTFRGSILPTLNKKLIANSLNILFDLLQKCNSKSLVTETSAYLMGGVYKMFRVIYSANPRNEEGLFGVSSKLCRGYTDAVMHISEERARLAAQETFDDQDPEGKIAQSMHITTESLSKTYPLFASSLLNLIQSTEGRMNFSSEKGEGGKK